MLHPNYKTSIFLYRTYRSHMIAVFKLSCLANIRSCYSESCVNVPSTAIVQSYEWSVMLLTFTVTWRNNKSKKKEENGNSFFLFFGQVVSSRDMLTSLLGHGELAKLRKWVWYYHLDPKSPFENVSELVYVLPRFKCTLLTWLLHCFEIDPSICRCYHYTMSNFQHRRI